MSAGDGLLSLIVSISAVAIGVGFLYLKDVARRRRSDAALREFGLERSSREAVRALRSMPILSNPGERSPEIRDLAQGVVNGFPLSVFLFWNDPVTPAIGPLGLLALIEAVRTRSTLRRCVLIHLAVEHPTESFRVKRGSVRVLSDAARNPTSAASAIESVRTWAHDAPPCVVRIDRRWLMLESASSAPVGIGAQVRAAVSLAERLERVPAP
jgi:hypothetical protein